MLSNHDFPSPALRPFAAGGVGEYEYFTDVPAAAKDQLLIALLVERYRGNPNAVEDLLTLVRSKRNPLSLLRLGWRLRTVSALSQEWSKTGQ